MRTIIAVLVALALILVGCASQSVTTPDTLHIVTNTGGATPPAWKPADQQAAVTWLATHQRKVGHNRYYGVVVATGMEGNEWDAVMILPTGKIWPVLGADRSDDLLIQRGDAIETHQYSDFGFTLIDDPPTVIVKQAVAFP